MKILVNVNGVSYYTTRAALKKQTSSNNSMQNSALEIAHYTMGKDLGYAATLALYDGKMKRHEFVIQLSVC